MTEPQDKTRLCPLQLMAVIEEIQDAASIQQLLSAAIENTDMKMVSYHYISGPGANDHRSLPRHFSYNLPQVLEKFLDSSKLNRDDPGVVAAFSAGTPIWLSDLLEHQLVKNIPVHAANIQALLDLTGDGLLLALYGPADRKGYAFVTFGKAKDQFDPPFEWQVNSMLQMLHVRYCLILNDLQDNVKLTKREIDVLELVVLGKTNPEIGIILDISKNTVASYIKGIFLKLQTNDRVTAALRARALNLVA